MLRLTATLALLGTLGASAQKIKVPAAAPQQGKTSAFHDGHYGVSFDVPPGWNLSKKDRQVSTFRLDAKSAKPATEMRAVAILDFNPFPLSTLSGALFYFSVERHATDRDCEQQAIGKHAASSEAEPALEAKPASSVKDIQNIGGMNFAHGHEENGNICTESRDDVYTTFRRGSCYRFDLTVNLFCSQVSGAEDLTLTQMNTIESQMAGILSTVSLDWEKSGAHPVAPPNITPDEKPLPSTPKRGTTVTSPGRAVGTL